MIFVDIRLAGTATRDPEAAPVADATWPLIGRPGKSAVAAGNGEDACDADTSR